MAPGRSIYKRRGKSVPLRPRFNVDPSGIGEVVVGSVVIHRDASKEHVALILDLGDQYAMALFFSSMVYGLGYREATLEELALAGYVYTRQTFLCLVHRPSNEFYPHQGLEFPEHRVQKLRREFRIDQITRTQSLQP